MYKLLLVDDEDEVREGICATVDFESCGFVLCAQATGAIDAIGKAGQFQPDVVFTDVHMPYMDGMEMISRLQDMYPTMKYIVLSGYDDFVYVKQALQRQVLDYLLKPISASNIEKVLRRTKEQLDEQNRQRMDLQLLNEKVTSSTRQLRHSVIREYLSGGGYVNAHALCMYPSPMDERIMLPAYIAVLSLERTEENVEVLRSTYNSQPMLLGESVQEVLREVFRRRSGEFLHYHSQIVMFLPVHQEQAIRTCDDAIQSLKYYLNLSAAVGLSDEITSYDGIQDGYENALAALDKRMIAGYGRVYMRSMDSENRMRKVENGIWLERVGTLCRNCSETELETFAEELKQYFASAQMEPRAKQLMLLELLSAAMNSAKRAGVEQADVLGSMHLETMLQPGMIATTGVEQLSEIIRHIAEAVRKDVTATGSDLIAQAVSYTHKNYADKDLSLESLCNHFDISQTQFSLLFKREMGTSFLQYLLDIRITAAQELLAHTGQKIYQIAEATGFGDASYFSYCFKQRCGMSPKEYRMQEGE